MQRFKDRLRIAWTGKQIQYSPHEGLARSNFSTKSFEQTKKFSSFGKGTARWMFSIHLCRNHLLWTFAAGTLWKTQSWDIFARVHTAKYIASCNHDGSLEDNYCAPFFKLKFLIPTLRNIFCLPKSSKIYEESDFESSVSRNKLGKYTWLWFKKRDFYF